MEIEFRDKDLEICAIDEAYAIRRMGQKRAKIYQKRVKHIMAANDFADLKNFPGRFYELLGNPRDNGLATWINRTV